LTSNNIKLTVFTKPWKTPIDELARQMAAIGFDGVELPVRPGYPVNPENMATELPRAARILGDAGLEIASIAGPTDERSIATCAESGVPVIRICLGIRKDESYREGERRWQAEFDAAVPLLERYGVTLGIQNHSGRDVCNAMGLDSLLAKYDRKHVAAVWDCAHNALQGEEPELALDIIWPQLGMVNLKNAFWKRTSGPEAPSAAWKVYWTSGPQGLASWPRVVRELKRRAYSGVVCLTAEYTDEEAVDRLIASDLAYARGLFAAEG